MKFPKKVKSLARGKSCKIFAQSRWSWFFIPSVRWWKHLVAPHLKLKAGAWELNGLIKPLFLFLVRGNLDIFAGSLTNWVCFWGVMTHDSNWEDQRIQLRKNSPLLSVDSTVFCHKNLRVTSPNATYIDGNKSEKSRDFEPPSFLGPYLLGGVPSPEVPIMTGQAPTVIDDAERSPFQLVGIFVELLFAVNREVYYSVI